MLSTTFGFVSPTSPALLSSSCSSCTSNSAANLSSSPSESPSSPRSPGPRRLHFALVQLCLWPYPALSLAGGLTPVGTPVPLYHTSLGRLCLPPVAELDSSPRTCLPVFPDVPYQQANHRQRQSHSPLWSRPRSHPPRNHSLHLHPFLPHHPAWPGTTYGADTLKCHPSRADLRAGHEKPLSECSYINQQQLQELTPLLRPMASLANLLF
jgi:hypothetical protein